MGVRFNLVNPKSIACCAHCLYFSVEIISPDKSILKMETSEVVIPSFEGEMGILKDHIPLITFLRPGFINIKNQDEKKYFVDGGCFNTHC